MTGPAAGEPDRGTDVPARMTRTREAVAAIVAILALGLAFRIIIAYLLPGSGFTNDLASFRGWAHDLATNGLAGFYTRPGFHDYTPGYLYALWLVGIIEQVLPKLDLIKIPAILADLALGKVTEKNFSFIHQGAEMECGMCGTDDGAHPRVG